MHKTKELIMDFAPFVVGLIFGIVALCLHPVACAEVNRVVYIQIPVCVVVPLVFPALKKWAKINVPYFLIVFVTVQIIISVYLGTALNFYSIPHYDKFLHTYFGVWCAPLVLYFINRFGGAAMKGWCKFIVVMFSVFGVAGLWEIFEFSMSLILDNYDPQLWQAAVAAGENPLWDTMFDIIVAGIGACIFYVTLFVDVRTHGKIYRGTLNPSALSSSSGGVAQAVSADTLAAE